MALYEYKCPECDDSFDLMRPMSASDDPASCPGCGFEGAMRSMTTSFVSIGSGAANTATNPMMDSRMSRGAVGGGCGSGCGCH
ncbi:MAG: zinc ribbon domain-containing protein [Actinomycetota bacterium]|nr:zinc ribbon domain-containing protein [Actinomycetota bacterium]